jgi:REP element-mobilizing transposase RayT
MIYDWLKLIADKYGIQTHAFVLMPNHVHLLLRIEDAELNLNKIISNGKRFMAYEIIKRLKSGNKDGVLFQLSSGCTAMEISKGQLHKVFESSFDAKPVYSRDFLHQKLDYIHHNPVIGKWNLCNEFTDYSHSSASFYIDEKPHEVVLITDFRKYWV